jgi:hypothetical protein
MAASATAAARPLQLDRSETRHELACRLFFANQGAFRDYEEIVNKVSERAGAALERRAGVEHRPDR